jgi:uncharacterized lipoprotein
MRRQFTAVAAVLALCLLAGCNADPRTQLSDFREAHALELRVVNAAYDAGAIAPADLLKLNATYEQPVRAAEAAAAAYLKDHPEGGQAFDMELRAANAALSALGTVRRQATTKPTGAR